MSLRFAFNTNGVSNHRFEDALYLIADSGYDGVALTLDHHHFDPFAFDFERRADDLVNKLDKLRLGLVVETGARFLLDPRQKHEPTLLSPEPEGRKKRIEFLKLAVDLANIANAEAVSFWAGVPRAAVDNQTAWQFLREGLREIVDYAGEKAVCAAFEPEPGMLIETVADFRSLKTEFPSLKIALDTGHCLVTEDCAPENAVIEMAQELGTVAIEDMRRGVHEHIFFGEGDMNIPAVLDSLKQINFQKLVCVELSRDAHRAHEIVPRAIEYLRTALVKL